MVWMDNSAAITRESEENQRIQQDLDRKAKSKNLLNIIIPYIGLGFLFVFFIIVTQGKFISTINIENLITQSFSLTIIAIGASFVYAHGGTDFSIGATCGCAQLVCGLLIVSGYPLWIAIAACILVTILGASATAGIALGLGVPVFIGSMCVRTTFNGILQYVAESGEVVIDYKQYMYMNSTYLKVIILVVFLAVGYYLFNYTVFGKYNKAIGGNPVTAVQAGVKHKKLIFAAYVALGLCVGVAAVFTLFRTGKVTGTTGSGVEFNMMMAIALGGFPMRGGERSRLSAAIVGAVTITVLANGLQLWGLDPATINCVKGVLFVLIVALSYDRSDGKLIS